MTFPRNPGGAHVTASERRMAESTPETPGTFLLTTAFTEKACVSRMGRTP